jgi:hypothetical protein
MPLFEVAIIQKPSKKEAEEGATEKLIFGPKPVMAQNDQGAAIAAVTDKDIASLGLDMTKMEVLIRPFA